MELVKFRQWKDQYSSYDANTVAMSILGNFLTSDVGCYNAWYKEWVVNSRYEYTGGNYSALEKNGDYVVITFEFEPDSFAFLKIHKDALMKILDAWENFCKTRPKVIIITKKNDDTFIIEAKN